MHRPGSSSIARSWRTSSFSAYSERLLPCAARCSVREERVSAMSQPASEATALARLPSFVQSAFNKTPSMLSLIQP